MGERTLADIAGFMPSYWVIIAALGYLLFYGLVGCKNVNKDIKVGMQQSFRHSYMA